MDAAEPGLAVRAPAAVPASRLRARAWVVALGLGLVAVAGYFLLPGTLQRPTYVGIGLVSLLAVLFGVRLHRPARAGGWYLLVGANLCFVGGDETANLYETITGHDVPTPSVADVLYLAGYPLLIAAVLVLARAGGIAATREQRIDAAVITVGALASGWQPLVEPITGSSAASVLGRLVIASYPVMDVGVLFIVVSAMISARTSTPAQRLVALSIGAMMASDVVYTLATLGDTYEYGDPVDVGWLLSYVLFAVAALHPSMAADPPGAVRDDHVTPHTWFAVVSVAAFLPLTLVMARTIERGDDGSFAGPVAFSIATLAFVGVRTLLLFGRVGRQSRELAAQARSLRAALAAEQALKADLRRRAYHDDLTGLPNRAWLHDQLEDALATAGSDRRGVALCLADLDRFKSVNDTLGHPAGDRVLLEVARRLRALTPDGVVVGRLGGDEFACVLRTADPATAARAAQAIVDVLREPVEVDGRRILLSTSVGLAEGDRASTGAVLLARADIAMYAAKTAGRDRWMRYEPSMGELLEEQHTITDAFADALRHEQFTLVYQPVFRCADGGLKGFESLVRWDHPTLGPIGPQRFVPLAEETGFVVTLGRWVLRTACRTAVGWPGGPTVAVNVSARQLADPQLVTDVAMALAESGLPARRLILEVTESAVMADVDHAARTVAALKGLGVVIAIDDFGTGHSSLAHLRDLPIDILKIDRSFVTPLGTAATDAAAFVDAIVGLARALGMTTVAEGVESTAQFELLRALGCDTVQGFLTGRPLAPDTAAGLAGTASIGRSPHWSSEPVPA